jgi:voltage-gated potassium channel
MNKRSDPNAHSLKAQVHMVLEGEQSSRGVAIFISSLIILNVLAVIIATVEPVATRIHGALLWFEVFSIVVFSLEYLLRVWCCTVEEQYAHPVLGRLKYAFTPMALVDLFAVLPFYAPFLIRVDLRFLRALRLLRLTRLLKLGRYSESLKTVTRVVRSKKEQLSVAVFVVAILLVVASSAMYYLEHDAQPKVFSSIPAAMWWGVVTLTTVGYGDIYPVTTLGKVIGAMIALLGVGLFALPAGILASGFAAELRVHPEEKRICPHCGSAIDARLDEARADHAVAEKSRQDSPV